MVRPFGDGKFWGEKKSGNVRARECFMRADGLVRECTGAGIVDAASGWHGNRRARRVRELLVYILGCVLSVCAAALSSDRGCRVSVPNPLLGLLVSGLAVWPAGSGSGHATAVLTAMASRLAGNYDKAGVPPRSVVRETWSKCCCVP